MVEAQDKMRKFWKAYSWVYLIVVIYGIYYYAVNPVEIPAEINRISYIIAYVLISLFSLVPVLGLFLYAFNRRKKILFWRVYCIYFAYSTFSMLVDFFKTQVFSSLFPFHAIALTGLLLYSFQKNSAE